MIRQDELRQDQMIRQVKMIRQDELRQVKTRLDDKTS